MFFRWETWWAAGVSRSRARLRNVTRRGDRTRRATSRRLKMIAASPTPSARRRARGPRGTPETAHRRYVSRRRAGTCGPPAKRPGHSKDNRATVMSAPETQLTPNFHSEIRQVHVPWRRAVHACCGKRLYIYAGTNYRGQVLLVI